MKDWRTPKEAVSTALAKVEAYIEMGLCFECALTVTASFFKCDRDKLETLWIDSNIES